MLDHHAPGPVAWVFNFCKISSSFRSVQAEEEEAVAELGSSVPDLVSFSPQGFVVFGKERNFDKRMLVSRPLSVASEDCFRPEVIISLINDKLCTAVVGTVEETDDDEEDDEEDDDEEDEAEDGVSRIMIPVG